RRDRAWLFLLTCVSSCRCDVTRRRSPCARGRPVETARTPGGCPRATGRSYQPPCPSHRVRRALPARRRVRCVTRTRLRRLGSGAAEDVADAVEAGGDVALGAAGLWLVVAAPDQLVGQVLLGGDRVRDVVGVDVLLAVSQLLGARVVGV